MTDVIDKWHIVVQGPFEIRVLPIFFHRNVSSGDISNEPYTFICRVTRVGTAVHLADTFHHFRPDAGVEYRTPQEALDAGLIMGRRIIAGDFPGICVDD